MKPLLYSFLTGFATVLLINLLFWVVKAYLQRRREQKASEQRQADYLRRWGRHPHHWNCECGTKSVVQCARELGLPGDPR